MCKTRTVGIPLAFPNDTSGFGLLSQGKKEIKWINGFPPVMWECVEWLCDSVLSKNRHLAQWKATTSSEINQVRFRSKKGLNICLLPGWLLFKGEEQQLISKGTRSSWVESPHWQRKEGLVSDRGPKRPMCTTRSAPQGGEMFPTTESEHQQLGHQRWVLARLPRDLPTSSYSLPEGPQTAISRDRLFGTIHFLQYHGLVRQAVIFPSLNPETIECSKSNAELLENIFQIISIESSAF